MKKFLFSLLVCATGPVAQAQVTKLPEGFTSGKMVWMIRAGVCLNGVSGDGVDATLDNWEKSKPNNKWDYSGDFKRALGGNLNIGFYKSFGTSPIYWGMELGVAIRGYKGEAAWNYGALSSVSGGYDSHTRAQRIILNAFSAQFSPINIGYKLLLNENMAVDVHVGGFASYDFAGKFKSEYEDRAYSTSKYGNSIKDTKVDSSTDISDLDGYRNYDFGAIGGVGFWYGHFNIDVSYQRGFISVFEGDNTYFCDKLQVRLGYAF